MDNTSKTAKKTFWKDLKDCWNNSKVFWKDSCIDCLIYAFIISLIILLLDIFDIYSYCKYSIGKNNTLVIGIVSCIIIFLIIFKHHYIELFKIPCVNESDVLLVSISISVLVIETIEVMLDTIDLFKFVGLLIILFLSLTFLVLRFNKCMKKSVTEYKKTRLEDFIQSDIGIKSDRIKTINESTDIKRPLLQFSDDVSNIDLLDREGLVEYLYNSVNDWNSDQAYVIGINGTWGSGKSTIINLLKNKIKANNSNIIIDDIDSCVLGTQEVLLHAINDKILSNTGIKYSTYENRYMLENLVETMTNQGDTSALFAHIFRSGKSKYETLNIQNHKLKAYLGKNNEKIVFIIDNIDRAEASIIIFLFKLIGTIYNLPNIVYILTYDIDRLNDIFSDTNTINPKYMEKIIQKEIIIPAITPSIVQKSFENVINKVLVYYGVDENNLDKFYIAKELIFNFTKTPRQFIRLINSSFGTTFSNLNELYKPHLLSVEIIRALNPDLYDFIRDNQGLFVPAIGINIKDTINDDIKKISKFDEYIDYINELFPNNLLHKIIENTSPKHLYTHQDKVINKISDERYFELYFTYGTNEYMQIYVCVEKYIDNIKQYNDAMIYDFTVRTIKELNFSTLREWLEYLHSMINSIPLTKRLYVANAIFDSMITIYKNESFVTFTYNRAVLVGIDLLEDIDISTSFNMICNVVEKNFDIRLVHKIHEKCTSSENTQSLFYTELSRFIDEEYEKLCSIIVNKRINILCNDYYQKKNILLLHDVYTSNHNKKYFQEYLKQIINKDTVYRFLNEFIDTTEKSSSYVYTLNKSLIYDMLGDTKLLQDILDEANPQNDSEKIIISLWNAIKDADQASATSTYKKCMKYKLWI